MKEPDWEADDFTLKTKHHAQEPYQPVTYILKQMYDEEKDRLYDQDCSNIPIEWVYDAKIENDQSTASSYLLQGVKWNKIRTFKSLHDFITVLSGDFLPDDAEQDNNETVDESVDEALDKALASSI